MRESCMSGSVRGASSDRRLYSTLLLPQDSETLTDVLAPCVRAMGQFGLPKVSVGFSMLVNAAINAQKTNRKETLDRAWLWGGIIISWRRLPRPGWPAQFS
jgi:hypothetical protein